MSEGLWDTGSQLPPCFEWLSRELRQGWNSRKEGCYAIQETIPHTIDAVPTWEGSELPSPGVSQLRQQDSP